MARARIKMLRGGMAELLKSHDIEVELWKHAAPVGERAKQDPNLEYALSIELKAHRSGGARGRVGIRVGASPVLGMPVEAKRGTLARALGEA